MKAVFGILSLVVVLAALAFVAKRQLQAADRGAASVPQQARGVQERARDDTVRALQQGAERNKRADEP